MSTWREWVVERTVRTKLASCSAEAGMSPRPSKRSPIDSAVWP